MDAATAAAGHRKEEDAKKRPGRGGGGGDPRGRGPGVSAAAECVAECCVLCACLPVAVLCCVARAPLRAARGCCCQWRRRPRRRLAPGGSSSFSDAEVGEFLQGGRRRATGQEESQPPARSRLPRGGRTALPPAPARQPSHRDRRR